MQTRTLQSSLLDLVRRTSTDLPADVEDALRRARRREAAGSPARWVLDEILRNVALARADQAPICQDTGALLFFCRLPPGCDGRRLQDAARHAVAQATERGYLRRNTIDTLSGRSVADNIAPGAPAFSIEYERGRRVPDIRLVLKGGGSENVSIQYSLPDDALEAGRDEAGMRRCALDAVLRAQGFGCAPGVLGVCFGGDRSQGYAHAKRQFLRPLGEPAGDARLARLERRILADARQLDIGPMGLGGRTTLLAVHGSTLSRLPASCFVTVSYMCWAFRRRGFELNTQGGIRRWLYE